MSKAVRFDFNWPKPPAPEEEVIAEPTKDEVRGKRDHNHHARDKNKKDKKFENGWN